MNRPKFQHKSIAADGKMFKRRERIDVINYMTETNKQRDYILTSVFSMNWKSMHRAFYSSNKLYSE